MGIQNQYIRDTVSHMDIWDNASQIQNQKGIMYPMFKIKRELCIPCSKSKGNYVSHIQNQMIIILLFRSLPVSSHLTITYLSTIEGKCIILTGSTISAPMYQLYTKLIALYESSYWGRNSSEVVVWTTSEQPEHQHRLQVMSNNIAFKLWAFSRRSDKKKG